MNKKIIINKKMLILFLVIFLLLFTSCKQSTDAETTEQTETEETDTKDIFDDVLSGANTAETTSDTTDNSENERSEEITSEDDKESADESYTAPSCGDSICTYYETFSSCPDDCEKLVDTTLFDYPDFLDNPLIVVGDDAPTTDVITATVISTYLITHDITAETKLASEIIDFSAQDLILIGSPCENEAIASLLHYNDETCTVVSSMNNAVIKLLVSDTNEIIIITGYDNEDTKDASIMLTTDEVYNLNGAEEWINLDSDGDINMYFSKN